MHREGCKGEQVHQKKIQSDKNQEKGSKKNKIKKKNQDGYNAVYKWIKVFEVFSPNFSEVHTTPQVLLCSVGRCIYLVITY